VRIKRTKSLERFIKVSEKMEGPRVLVADIETFPIWARVWGMFKQNISLEQIVKDWTMMSFAAKWLQQPEVYYLDNRMQVDSRDDSLQLAALYHILLNTDMIIAHNGQRFDLPKIKARLAIKKFRPLPPLKVIDTLNLNRTAFGFTSQKLQYITGEHTGFASEGKSDHKKYPGWKLWVGCEEHDLGAWKECEAYNITDITSLEESYLELRGWYQAQPNFGPYVVPGEKGELVCPNCGSTHLHRHKERKTQVGIYPQYHCQSCGTYPRGRYQCVSRADREHILMN
jgi:predicted RNA-binding Zn-ribbon protein involved in translation (DUF1610 family)